MEGPTPQGLPSGHLWDSGIVLIDHEGEGKGRGRHGAVMSCAPSGALQINSEFHITFMVPSTASTLSATQKLPRHVEHSNRQPFVLDTFKPYTKAQNL